MDKSPVSWQHVYWKKCPVPWTLFYVSILKWRWFLTTVMHIIWIILLFNIRSRHPHFFLQLTPKYKQNEMRKQKSYMTANKSENIMWFDLKCPLGSFFSGGWSVDWIIPLFHLILPYYFYMCICQFVLHFYIFISLPLLMNYILMDIAENMMAFISIWNTTW